jgi:hypothetical protein
LIALFREEVFFMTLRGIAVATVCAVALYPAATRPSRAAEKDTGVSAPKTSVAAPAQPGVWPICQDEGHEKQC